MQFNALLVLHLRGQALNTQLRIKKKKIFLGGGGGEGGRGATKWEGSRCPFTPTKRGGAAKIIAMLNGGGHKLFEILSLSKGGEGGGVHKVLPHLAPGKGGQTQNFWTWNFPIL